MTRPQRIFDMLTRATHPLTASQIAHALRDETNSVSADLSRMVRCVDIVGLLPRHRGKPERLFRLKPGAFRPATPIGHRPAFPRRAVEEGVTWPMRIFDVLTASPEAMTAGEIAELLGVPTKMVASDLSRMRVLYVDVVAQIKSAGSKPCNCYRLRPGVPRPGTPRQLWVTPPQPVEPPTPTPVNLDRYRPVVMVEGRPMQVMWPLRFDEVAS